MTPLPIVHQLLPTLWVGDAAGSHTLAVQRILREAGFVSEVFVEHHHESFAGQVHHYSELGAHCGQGRTALIYQLAIGSKIADMLMQRPEPMIVNYHNLTPASFFWRWDPALVDGIVWGHLQLHQLAQRTHHAIAVSRFNERDLLLAGYNSTQVAPPLLSFAPKVRSSSDVRRSRSSEVRKAGARWLFVGRLAPNKAGHDLVKAFAAYQRTYDPEAELTLVGGQGHPVYTEAVECFVATLGLADRVRLAGSVSHAELDEAYRSADVFVCLSDHEGFCFPLLEAMDHGLPVVAYGSSAIAETVGAGGLVLADKRPPTVAAAVHEVLTRIGLKERMIASGRQRVDVFRPEVTSKMMLDAVRRGLVIAELLEDDALGRASAAR